MTQDAVCAGVQLLAADGTLKRSAFADEAAFGSSRLGHVFAVLGAQSSGKSTLCNSCFGASLPTLDVASGAPRSQTTEGVWLAFNARENHVVLDCEGADSRERGAGQVAFERQIAGLVVEVADTILLNVWAHDLGRVQGAGYHLVEMMLACWARKTRARPMHLVFVLRDLDEEQTPVEQAENLLEADVQEMWTRLASTNMPLRESNIVLQVISLPHFRFRAEQWREAAAHVPRRAAESYPGQPGTTPLDLLGDRISAIWASSADGNAAATVSNLPSHTVLAQSHRRKRVIAGVAQISSKEVDELSRHIEDAIWAGGPKVNDFGKRAEDIIVSATVRYEKAMGMKERSQDSPMVEKLAEMLLPLREAHLRSHEETIARLFDDKFMVMLAGSRNFEKNAKSLAEECTNMLKKEIILAFIPSIMTGDAISDPILLEFQARIDEQIGERNALGEAMAPIPGEDLMIDADIDPPPWWKPLVMQIANLALNLGVNWALVKVLGGGRDDPARRQRRLERKQPQSPTF